MLLLGRDFGLHHFQGHAALQLHIFGLEDQAHAAFAKQFQDAVAVEPADLVRGLCWRKKSKRRLLVVVLRIRATDGSLKRTAAVSSTLADFCICSDTASRMDSLVCSMICSEGMAHGARSWSRPMESFPKFVTFVRYCSRFGSFSKDALGFRDAVRGQRSIEVFSDEF